jgi:hypothetical protein
MKSCQDELYVAQQELQLDLGLITLLLDNEPRHSNRSIRGHLFWAKATTFKSLLSQLRSPI